MRFRNRAADAQWQSSYTGATRGDGFRRALKFSVGLESANQARVPSSDLQCWIRWRI
jgi:hypothetical protein